MYKIVYKLKLVRPAAFYSERYQYLKCSLLEFKAIILTKGEYASRGCKKAYITVAIHTVVSIELLK
jgi:hypothetical protein